LIVGSNRTSLSKKKRPSARLGVPVHNLYGLRPAQVKGRKEITPLTAFRDIDKLGLLKNVPTLNFHPHLPHYEPYAVELLSDDPSFERVFLFYQPSLERLGKLFSGW
jgi:hypothetical protein